MRSIERLDNQWQIQPDDPSQKEQQGPFDALILATPAKVTARLLSGIDPSLAGLLPQRSSSAIVVNLAFALTDAASLDIPQGFGFLVSHSNETENHVRNESKEFTAQRAFLACTFVDQKFPDRVPEDGRLLRVFFGGPEVELFLDLPDAEIQWFAHRSLSKLLGRLPDPQISLIRRLPDSMPLYAVGHVERIANLESQLANFPTLKLIGNAYKGVGLPDLIAAARNAARETLRTLAAG